MDNFYKRNFNNLQPINETNEYSNLYNSEKQDSGSPIRINSKLSRNKENNFMTKNFMNQENTNNLKFTNNTISNSELSKIPRFISDNKFLFGKESSIKAETINNTIFTKSNMSYFSKNFSTSSPILFKDGDAVIVSNFNPNYLQKVINEFKKFGKVIDCEYNEREKLLYLQYDNTLSASNSLCLNNVNLVDNKEKLIVLLQRSSDYPNKKEIIGSTKSKKDLNLPSVSLLNKIIDYLFNW